MMSHPQSHVLPLVNLNLKHLRFLTLPRATESPEVSLAGGGSAAEGERNSPPLGNNKWDVIIVHLVQKKKKNLLEER